MFPQKGTIGIGSDADLLIFDPGKEHIISAETHHMNTDYSAYEGWEVKGKVRSVLLRGKLAINNNSCLVQRGNGKFIKRKKVTAII